MTDQLRKLFAKGVMMKALKRESIIRAGFALAGAVAVIGGWKLYDSAVLRVYKAGAADAVAEMSAAIQNQVIARGELVVTIPTPDGNKQVTLQVKQSPQGEPAAQPTK